MGITVKGLLIIDSPAPQNHVPLSSELIMSASGLSVDQCASDSSLPPRKEVSRLVQQQFAMNSKMLGDYDPLNSFDSAPPAGCPPVVFLRSKEGYSPPGVRNIPKWLADRGNPNLIIEGWKSLHPSVPFKCFDIPGHHFQALHPGHVSRSF